MKTDIEKESYRAMLITLSRVVTNDAVGDFPRIVGILRYKALLEPTKQHEDLEQVIDCFLDTDHEARRDGGVGPIIAVNTGKTKDKRPSVDIYNVIDLLFTDQVPLRRAAIDQIIRTASKFGLLKGTVQSIASSMDCVESADGAWWSRVLQLHANLLVDPFWKIAEIAEYVEIGVFDRAMQSVQELSALDFQSAANIGLGAGPNRFQLVNGKLSPFPADPYYGPEFSDAKSETSSVLTDSSGFDSRLKMALSEQETRDEEICKIIRELLLSEASGFLAVKTSIARIIILRLENVARISNTQLIIEIAWLLAELAASQFSSASAEVISRLRSGLDKVIANERLTQLVQPNEFDNPSLHGFNIGAHDIWLLSVLWRNKCSRLFGATCSDNKLQDEIHQKVVTGLVEIFRFPIILDGVYSPTSEIRLKLADLLFESWSFESDAKLASEAGALLNSIATADSIINAIDGYETEDASMATIVAQAIAGNPGLDNEGKKRILSGILAKDWIKLVLKTLPFEEASIFTETIIDSLARPDIDEDKAVPRYLAEVLEELRDESDENRHKNVVIGVLLASIRLGAIGRVQSMLASAAEDNLRQTAVSFLGSISRVYPDAPEICRARMRPFLNLIWQNWD